MNTHEMCNRKEIYGNLKNLLHRVEFTFLKVEIGKRRMFENLTVKNRSMLHYSTILSELN